MSHDQIDRLFHALGDATRRLMLKRLATRPLSASQLAHPLEITLTAVVQHLHILQAAQLIRTEKVGRTRTCRIDPAGFTILQQWVQEHRQLWERRLDRLGELLSEEKA